MTSGSWVSCGQRVVWDMGRTLREPPYGLAEPFPIRVPAGSKHQKALERSGLITRGRTAHLHDSPLKETATPATEGGGSAFAFTRGCCTKLSAKTWAALAVVVAEGAGSAEAGQGAPRASDDLRLFEPSLERLQ